MNTCDKIILKRSRHICFEGTEGVGKTTQVDNLVNHLTNLGFSVLKTKEPGTSHIPLTMQLRSIMLDNQYDGVLTRQAREFISQAIRSIHLEKLIEPASKEYDFIIQDRGVLSGLSYAAACGNDPADIMNMTRYTLDNFRYLSELYDDVVILKGRVDESLTRALFSKKEFEAGDAMEARGVNFVEDVSRHMDNYSMFFKNRHVVAVDNKSIQTVFDEILTVLRIDRNGKK
jgi:dTMP kinase